MLQNQKCINHPWRTLLSITSSRWFMPAIILVTGLSISLFYSFRTFVIIGDSRLEYNAYLVYVNQVYWRLVEEGYWSRVEEGMLSTTLWTTYLPAMVQRLFNFDNPEFAYRLISGILVGLLPLAVYLLMERYTTRMVAVMLTWIFYTSFYFQGFSEYARTQVAIIMAIFLFRAIVSEHRWKYLFAGLAIIGLAVAHYSTAYVYLTVLIAASIAALVLSVVMRKHVEYRTIVVFSTVILAVAVVVFYQYISQSPSQTYALNGIRRVVAEVSNVVDEPHLNIFEEHKLDIALAELLLLVRALIAIAILIVLLKRGQISTLVPVLYAIGIGVALVAIWSPIVGAKVGSLRPSYMLLPFELLGVAYWWSKRPPNVQLISSLILWSMIYH